jgi:hypothetical protein
MTLPDAMELARLNGELGLAFTEALVEIDRLRVTLAATPAPLDVERLARAVSHARTTIDGGGVYTGTGRWVPAADFAAAIAAAYAEEDGNAPSR